MDFQKMNFDYLQKLVNVMYIEAATFPLFKDGKQPLHVFVHSDKDNLDKYNVNAAVLPAYVKDTIAKRISEAMNVKPDSSFVFFVEEPAPTFYVTDDKMWKILTGIQSEMAQYFVQRMMDDMLYFDDPKNVEQYHQDIISKLNEKLDRVIVRLHEAKDQHDKDVHDQLNNPN